MLHNVREKRSSEPSREKAKLRDVNSYLVYLRSPHLDLSFNVNHRPAITFEPTVEEQKSINWTRCGGRSVEHVCSTSCNYDTLQSMFIRTNFRPYIYNYTFRCGRITISAPSFCWEILDSILILRVHKRHFADNRKHKLLPTKCKAAKHASQPHTWILNKLK